MNKFRAEDYAANEMSISDVAQVWMGPRWEVETLRDADYSMNVIAKRRIARRHLKGGTERVSVHWTLHRDTLREISLSQKNKREAVEIAMESFRCVVPGEIYAAKEVECESLKKEIEKLKKDLNECEDKLILSSIQAGVDPEKVPSLRHHLFGNKPPNPADTYYSPADHFPKQARKEDIDED